MHDPDARPYQPIEAYGLVSNCHGCALVARDGSIDWACLERFDAPPVFSRLLDRRRGGFFALAPELPFESARLYLPGTNILETTFTCAAGAATVHDFMLAPEPGRSLPCLVRLVSGVSGEVPMRAVYRPLAGFSERFPSLEPFPGGARAEGLPDLVADLPLSIEGGQALARFTIAHGAEHAFALHPGGADGRETARPRVLMEAARRAWTGWSASAAYDGPLADELLRSALTLKALTYAPSGAIVAAATTSLPEEIGGIRNWDYRFCWIRDACLSFYVLKKFGMVAEAEAFFRFVGGLAERDEGGLKPLYAIAGEADLTEHEAAHFEGWRGSAPVRYGNEAAEQHQSDAYGQVLDLLYLYRSLGGTIPEAMAAQGGAARRLRRRPLARDGCRAVGAAQARAALPARRDHELGRGRPRHPAVRRAAALARGARGHRGPGQR